ncbi:GNAT family protein [Anaerovoracaceae bacterium 41-7]|jgi:ribosomal-protein-alanine N-acetyltransferase|uniref:N-acetyltransferase n=1 Tax=Anaerotruncus colihominis TaxID=169435 RepID=A0A845QH02_9FIRM|nr:MULTISPECIES: GNAT family protein [Clostridia]MCI9476343.1 GNAT family N-acetyltransferase [Emergencia sp.]MCI9639361.1 GNAT family N-acetyltransferase [Emergencia sp.]NBH60684.1 N-acetyltransferase [Anaerotruncus colihominis]NCE99370.1 N-acetyltransferase [Emergencia sp. 1XD21-10]NCF01338.1 N-acetyltransferase [Anaerotruncus sp. 80]
MKSLETERLNLRMFTPEDAEDVYAYASNPNVGPPAGWAPHKSVEDSRKIIEEIFMPPEAWAICIKGDDRVVGVIALEPDNIRPEANSRELGYNLAEEHWGKGYMTEAAKEVLRFAFEELGLDQVGICTSRVNRRSQRIIEKCGFTYEGTIRRYYKIYDGSLRDSMVFSMLREEFFAGKDSK